MRAKSLQSRPTFCEPMDRSLPGSSVHGILQARILERVAMTSSRWSSWSKDRALVSGIAYTGRQVLLPLEPPGKPILRYIPFVLNLFQFSSVTQSCPTLCHPMNCSTPGLPAHHQLPEFTQTHIHRVRDAIQPSHPLSSPSPPTFSLSQHQGLFQWVSSSHQVAKVLEFQLQHQSFQWIFRTDFL